jgi:hypothetical protein
VTVMFAEGSRAALQSGRESPRWPATGFSLASRADEQRVPIARSRRAT